MANPDIHHQLSVGLARHEYPIHIGQNCLANGDLLRSYVKGPQLLIVTNTTVAPIYLKSVQALFSALQCDVVILPDGEQHKNQHSLFAIYDELIKKNHHRDTTLLALGGGVVGDITGFAAATYQRGVRFIQLPTTLLAQVDASVGGKTAINHPLGKNMIGSFYQPHAVIMDLNTLQTLPARELRSGYAEVIKYGLLAGGELLQILCDSFATDAILRPPLLADIIARCCQIKINVVQEDEREMGQRALLNLGHTFAHALEAYTHYQRWLHGEAVAIGLYCAALLSHHLGYLTNENLTLVDTLLLQAKLPRRIPKEIDLQALYALMFHDKKVKNKTLRFVLIRAPGDCYLDNEVTDDCLHYVLTHAVEGD